MPATALGLARDSAMGSCSSLNNPSLAGNGQNDRECDNFEELIYRWVQIMATANIKFFERTYNLKSCLLYQTNSQFAATAYGSNSSKSLQYMSVIYNPGKN